MSNTRLTANALRGFTGTEQYFRHGLVGSISYTEGVRFLAEQGGAYWLLDKIATLQLDRRIRRQPFQVWKLLVDGGEATLSMTSGLEGSPEFHREAIGFTDFPLAGVDVWLIDGIMMLPSEY